MKRSVLLILFCCLSLTLPLAAQNGEKLKSLFAKLDKNSDGEITPAEVPKQSESIRKADANKSGGLDLKELGVLLSEKYRALQPDPNAETQIIVAAKFPKDAPATLAQCKAAAEYSASKNGYSFLVMSGKTGEILFERYDKGWNPERPHRLASGTKSFSGVMLSAAVQDKLIALDEPVSETITEWKEDSDLAKITIRQLLSLTAGINPGENSKVPTYHDAISSAKFEVKAGSRFAYGPDAFQIFGEVMQRKLNANPDLGFSDPLAYLEVRIFEPIGMKYADWKHGADGKPKLPSGASITAREWAKFGKLLLDLGKLGGNQLFDAETFAECLKGSEVNQGYGITFWLLGQRSKYTEEISGAYMAAGKGKQRLYVLPKKNLIIVRQGESTRFDDSDLLQSFFQ